MESLIRSAYKQALRICFSKGIPLQELSLTKCVFLLADFFSEREGRKLREVLQGVCTPINSLLLHRMVRVIHRAKQ